MIQASNAYKSAVDGNGRRVQARVYLDGTLLDMPIGEVKLYKGCCGSKPEAGSIYVPYSDVEVKGTIDAAGGTPMRVDIGFMTGSAWEWVTVGSYVVSRIETQNDKVTIHGIGTIGLFGGQKAVITETSYSAIATQIGTAVGYAVQFVGLDPSGSFESPPEGTYRDILAQIAYNLGGFLTESADGKWTIAGFCSGTAVLVNADRMQEPPSFGYESYSLNGVEVESAEIDLTMGNPLFDPWDYLLFGEVYDKMHIDRSSGNLIVEDGSIVTGDIAFDDNSDGHLLYTYSGEPNVLFTLLREHLFVSQLNPRVVPCLQIVHTLNGGLSTLIDAHVESSTEEEATIQGPLNRQVIEANEKATEALESVQETTNFFWANEEGAHVTDKPKAEFIRNPAAGGWNTLVQAKGMAIRDGLTERMVVMGDGLRLNDSDSTQMFHLTSSEATAQRLYVERPEKAIDGKWYFSAVPLPNEVSNVLVFGATRNGEKNVGVISVSIPNSGTYTATATFPTAESAELTIIVDFETYSIEASAPDGVTVILDFAQYMAQTAAPLLTYGSRSGGKGAYSATFGEGLIADTPSQFVIGYYNENISDDLFEIGCGSSDSNRKTIFSVEANGSVNIAGGLTLNDGDGLADYVIDRGTSGQWTYMKWASGTAMCYGTITGWVSRWDSWGALYYGTMQYFNYPSGLFAAEPTLTAQAKMQSGSSGDLFSVGFSNDGAAARTPTMYPTRPTAGLTGYIYYQLQAWGRWK